jgi:2-Cys peroxiredoxin 5
MTILTAYQIRFLGDPGLEFTKALDLSFDGASIFGGDRSKRYALVIENGAVVSISVSPLPLRHN